MREKQLSQVRKEFANIRSELKNLADCDDIEDEIATHFLILNSDIQILNDNQDKIINFIHENLEYKEGKEANLDSNNVLEGLIRSGEKNSFIMANKAKH